MKKISGLLFSVLSLVLILNLVSAANQVLYISPADSDNIAGSTYQINVSMDTNLANATEIRIDYRLSTGGWVNIVNITNTSAQQTVEFLGTWDTTSLTDTINMTFNFTAYNSSSELVSSNATSAGIEIDNGAPTASYASTNIEQYGQLYREAGSFTFGIAADGTIGITNCSYVMNSQTYNDDASGNACSQSLGASDFSITSGGEYTYYLIARDDNGNETNTSTRQLTMLNPVSGSGGGGGESSTSSERAEENIGALKQEMLGEGIGDRAKGIASSGLDRVISFFSSIGDFFRNLFVR